MTVTNYAKKSRHGTAASSIHQFERGLIVESDPEIVAPARSLASKSLCCAKSGIISRDAICGQFALYGASPSTNSARIEEMHRLQEAYENDDGVSLFDHKRAMLRVVGGTV
ncbi:hypothetical protein M2R28_03160 [Aeromonas hydrophila]|uniref:hypothetical protein n=1 Tax=Aeromonas hydrophila TaxID=644 RepID=UPI001F4C2036|nr:hypothetical protein [Aeromonas hydrophila]MCO4198685.1 hypothetical protein [Aeromonas hydrophila]UNB60021.1 hypothetical protein MKW86_08040 [Aeromonas hydrophila]